ncbi:DUF2243 domain-containing protein [Cellulomonas sp.]|uniref:DUF2243 domain-containing protein n=1 Tax=Cellulomonas sp. TaxID=40001 RepID=UPI002810C63B|nr:DUF2243 domain-containing protein [Cellulomonas sp.]
MEDTTRGAAPERTRSALAAALVGAGLMAAVDEIVFHQLLGWHHFYDRSTPDVALLSDGLLHTAELVALVAGAFLLADLVRRRALVPLAAWAGGLLGAGGFQLLDGLVVHKVLRLHQVRYDVDLLPYDLAWNGFAVLLLVAGALLAVRVRRGTGTADAGATTTSGPTAGSGARGRRRADPTDPVPAGGARAPARAGTGGPPTWPTRTAGAHAGSGEDVPSESTSSAPHHATGRRRAVRPTTGATPAVDTAGTPAVDAAATPGGDAAGSPGVGAADEQAPGERRRRRRDDEPPSGRRATGR